MNFQQVLRSDGDKEVSIFLDCFNFSPSQTIVSEESCTQNLHRGRMAGESLDLSKAQWLIIIRHGDRWDYENKALWNGHESSRKGDPSLSALGHEQARETGVYLDKFFREQNIAAEDITWLSSPFVRCLQTSTMALNAMTFDGANKIPIHQVRQSWKNHVRLVLLLFLMQHYLLIFGFSGRRNLGD